MARYYVYSGAAGAGTGADWANAYTTLAAALSGKAAGDTFVVAHDHAETQASSMTLTSPGTAANPCQIYCANRAGSVPPVSADLRTTATITTTGANFIETLGSAYCKGITFNCGSSGTPTLFINDAGATPAHFTFEDCQLAIPSSGASQIVFGAGASRIANVDLINTTMKFGATNQTVSLKSSVVRWRNTPNAIVGSVPGIMFQPQSTAAVLILEGIDLSAAGSGKTLFSDNGTNNGFFRIFAKDCKLGASVTVASISNETTEVFLTRGDSAGASTRCERYAYRGSETTETSIVRTGGATDGATPQSRKIVTASVAQWILPFEALPISVWNEITGRSITVTIEGTWNSGSVPNNDDIWLEAEYLGAAGNPQGSFANNTKSDFLASGSALAASSKSWAGGGSGAGWSPFKLSVSFTPQMKGPITLYVKAAKASSTFYVDPLATIS